jgi:hypothetical protein
VPGALPPVVLRLYTHVWPTNRFEFTVHVNTVAFWLVLWAQAAVGDPSEPVGLTPTGTVMPAGMVKTNPLLPDDLVVPTLVLRAAGV